MEESKTPLSADVLALLFPRQRKTAKRLVHPRVQAGVFIGDRTFGIELSAPIEGLRLFDKLSYPMLGYLFHEIARKVVERSDRQPKSGRSRFRSTPTISKLDVALRTADLIGPPIWQWLTEKNKNGKSNADLIIGAVQGQKGKTAKDLFASVIQTNWELENGKWPGAPPTEDPDAFFRKLNKHNRLTQGYNILPLPPGRKMYKNILEKKQTYNFQLSNGQCILPKHMLPPLKHHSF